MGSLLTPSSSSSQPSPPPERSLPPTSSSSELSSSPPSQPPSPSTSNPLRISAPGSSQPSDTPLPSDVPSDPSSTGTEQPNVQTSDSITPSGIRSSPPSEPSLLNPPLTGSINHSSQFTTSTQSDAKDTGVPVNSTSKGFFGNKGAMAGTFTVVGIVAGLILLTIFLCCRRYRKNKEKEHSIPIQSQDMDISLPQMHDNPFADDPFASSGLRGSAPPAERYHGWEKGSSLSVTDEQAMGYVDSVSSTHGFNVQRNDIEDNVIYETRSPRLAGINPGIVVNYRNQNPDDPFSDRQVYQQKLQPVSHGKGPTTNNRFSITAPYQAHLPFPNWRRVSETPSSPSVYATSLPAVEDGESDHRLPTPTRATFQRTTGGPSQIYNWGASAKKPGSSGSGFPVIPEAYITPPDSDDGRGSPVRLPYDEPIPPPIPPKNPLRTAMSMRTLLNVHGGKVE